MIKKSMIKNNKKKKRITVFIKAFKNLLWAKSVKIKWAINGPIGSIRNPSLDLLPC
jgi:hypothetical protein